MSAADESIQVENVVASSDIGQELDMDVLADNLVATEYEPDRFPGLVYRLQDPTASVLLFRSGKVVSTGAKSVGDVKAALHVVLDELCELGVDDDDSPDIVVQHIVANGDLGTKLNLHAIAIGLGLENIEYEPQQFPGLVYRLDDPTVVALLFGSGKLVLTGGKHLDDITQALAAIKERLNEIGLIE